MTTPRDLDARLHAFVGRLPDSPADRWLLRLTRSANHGRLWLVLGLLLALRRGALRRGALRGIGSMAITVGLVTWIGVAGLGLSLGAAVLLGALRQRPQAIALPLVSGRDFHTKHTPSSAKAVYRP